MNADAPHNGDAAKGDLRSSAAIDAKMSLDAIAKIRRPLISEPAERFVASLASAWWDNPAQCYLALGETDLLTISPHPIHTVGLFYFSIGIGGGERVTAEVARCLVADGYEVVLFTDLEPTPEDFELPGSVKRVVIPGQDKASFSERCHSLGSSLRELHVDAMVYCQWLSHALPWDMLLCKTLNVFFVVYSQSSLRTMFCEANPVDYQLSTVYRYLDGLVVLSEADNMFWSTGVPRVWRTFNPCTLIPGSVKRSALDNQTILWLGRLSEFDKRPSEALRIMALVHSRMPEAKLLMVGPAPNDNALADLKQLAIDLDVDECVEFVGSSEDVASYYQIASVYLLTSRYEGWCLSLAESKAVGVPCVSYDLPYLALFEGHRGMLVSRQRDREDAAEKICRILADRELRIKLGDDAYHHAEEIAKFDFADFWDRALSEVSTGTPSRSRFAALDCVSDTLLGGCLESLERLLSEIEGLGLRLDHSARQLEEANKTISGMQGSLDDARQQIASQSEYIDELLNSTTWRVGSAVTWLPRKAKDKWQQGRS